MDASTLDRIREIVGKENILDSEEDRLVYSYDGTPLIQHKPEAIVMPKDAGEISGILKLANETGFNIVPRGSGTGLSG